jgi:hypothetical protein
MVGVLRLGQDGRAPFLGLLEVRVDIVDVDEHPVDDVGHG